MPFYLFEWCMEWASYIMSRQASFKVLEFIGRMSVLVAVIFYFLEADDRKQTAHRIAWHVINSANGQSGDGGRSDALEFLNRERVDLQHLDANNAFLQGINLPAAKLPFSNFRKASLSSANFQGAALVRTDFRDALLSKADLSYSYLWQANLRGALLTKSNLQEATLRMADLRGAFMLNTQLDGANIDLANFKGAKELSIDALKTAKKWELACYDKKIAFKLGLPISIKCDKYWDTVDSETGYNEDSEVDE